jgi:Conjugal transfer protein TrbL
VDWVAGSLIDAILTWLAGVIVGGLDTLWGLLAATVFVSPDVTLLPQVRSVSATSLAIVNTAYVLAILWMAILVMGRDTIQSRYGPGELIPRLVIGLIGANLAMPLCSTLIQLANATTGALTDQDITSPASMQQMRTIVAGGLTNQTGTSPASFLMLLIGLVIAVMVGMLVVQWIVRLGVLIVAVGVAPIALALHGTPQTEPAAKLWWRTVLGTLGTVIIQAVALHTTLTVFLDPQANLPMLGIPADPGVVFNMLIVLCLLWATIKVPSMMRRYITKSSPSHGGTILRVVLIQQLTRGVSRALGRGGGVARNAGRGAGAGVRRGGGSKAGRGGDPPWPVTSPRGRRPLP